jgi:hypothetical protein
MEWSLVFRTCSIDTRDITLPGFKNIAEPIGKVGRIVDCCGGSLGIKPERTVATNGNKERAGIRFNDQVLVLFRRDPSFECTRLNGRDDHKDYQQDEQDID